MDIPSDAKPLPLTYYTDFSGVTFIVTNTEKNIYLFSLSDKLIPVSVDGKEIDTRVFSRNQVLKSGKKLLVISDKTPWVENRIGHDYGATRKDIMLVENGVGSNTPIQSYSTSVSRPEGSYRDVGTNKIVVKGIVFNRTANSTKKTYLLKMENQSDVTLSNISITTPEGSGLNGDRAMDLANCVNVKLEDISINGTYSLPKQYGYGITLDNICAIQVNNMFGRGNWGIFGNNNVQQAVLKNCDINRFDIHCYGKDVSFENCNFVDLYNQFASVYGDVVFKDCTFSNFTPVLMGSSYNAYTAYDIRFENCTFNLDAKHASIVDFSGFCETENTRPELKEKCLPNVAMRNCKVNVSGGLKKWFVINTKKTGEYDGVFSHLSSVTVEGLSYPEKQTNMELFSKSVRTRNSVRMKKN